MVLLLSLALWQASTQLVPEQPWLAGHIVTTLPLQSTTLCRSLEQCVAHPEPSPEASPKPTKPLLLPEPPLPPPLLLPPSSPLNPEVLDDPPQLGANVRMPRTTKASDEQTEEETKRITTSLYPHTRNPVSRAAQTLAAAILHNGL